MEKGRTSVLIVKMPFPAKAVDKSARPSHKKSRSTLWREKLEKENPDRYGELKKVDRQRKKREYQRELLDESRTTRYKRKLKQEKKATQQRQRRRRQRLAKQSETTTEGSSSVTTNDDKDNKMTKQEKQNQYMKEYMHKNRASMSRQKKQAVKEKDKQRKTLATTEQSGTGTSSNGSMKDRKRKECQPCLPDTPQRFADVIGSVLDSSTPKKIKALEERGIPATEEGRKKFSLMSRFGEETKKLSESCKKKKTSASKKVQRTLNQTIANIVRKRYGYGNAKGGKYHTWNYASKCFGINWRQRIRTAAFTARKKRDDAVPDPVKSKVAQFYKSPQVSQTRPDKKLGKKGVPTYIMNLSYKKAYLLWKKEHPNTKLGFTKFYHLKPKNVKTLSCAWHIGCLCVYCVNIKEKLKAIDYKIRSMQKEDELKDSRISDEKELYNMLLCEKSDANKFHNPQCVNGTCHECNSLDETIKTFYDQFIEATGDGKVCWKKWEMKKIKLTKKQSGKFVETEACRRVLTNKEGTATEMIEELIHDVVSPTRGTSFITHLFNASWQIYQVEKVLKEAVKKQEIPGIVMIIQDFGRNFSAKYQDEIKSAHWVKKDVTVHPMVAYYVDPVNGKFTRDSLVMLSDDLTHDHHIVEHFQHVAHNHLKTVRGLDVQLLVQINDGCVNQYKKAAAFADVSFSVEQFGYIVERGYYGSEHGKGESDGETSVVKGQAEKAILGRTAVIHTADTMYEFCKENLSLEGEDKGTHISRRSFFLIKKGEVNRSRPERCEGLKAVPQTRKLHSVRSTQAPFTIKKKQRSCFCIHCLKDETEKCSNTAYTGQWCDVNLKPGVKNQIRKTKDQENKKQKATKQLKVQPSDKGSRQDKKKAKHGDKMTKQSIEKMTVNLVKGINVSDYVAICFDAPSSSSSTTNGVAFMALVTAVINDNVTVKFMRRNSSGLYEFTEEREANQPQKDVIQKMTLPTMTPAGRAYARSVKSDRHERYTRTHHYHYYYKFEEGELNSLSHKFSLK